MCDPVTAAISLGGAAIGGLAQRSQQRKAQRAQEAAQRESLANQERVQANAAKAEANARRKPNYGQMFAADTQRRGAAGTLLTGAGGVSTGVTLARNTLLGGGQ